MKALVISREYPPAISGVATFIYEILSRIRSFDYKIICIKIRTRKKSKNIVEIKIPKVIWKRYFSAAYYAIRTVLKSLNENFDIIIGNALVGSAIATIIKLFKRKPLISIIHDIDYVFKEVEEFNWFNKLFRKFVQKIIFHSSDKVVVPSRKVKNDIINCHHINPQKISIIPNGVNIKKKFKKMRTSKNIILFVGPLLKKHSLEYLIKAFKIVNESIENLELWLIGPTIFKDYFESLRKLVHSYDLNEKIKFLGPVNDLASYYDACNVFAASSYHSVGFGIPCLEASSFGKPLVATKIYEQTGVVVNNKTGIVVPPKNPEVMAKAIIKLLKDKKLRERLGKNGKIFSKKFNWDNSAKKFEEVCLKLKK